MFEPVVHYLIQSVQVCARVTDLSVGEIVAWLLGLVVVLVGLATLRVRARR